MNEDFLRAVRALINESREGALHIATYQPKNDLLSAALAVDLLFPKEGAK